MVVPSIAKLKLPDLKLKFGNFLSAWQTNISEFLLVKADKRLFFTNKAGKLLLEMTKWNVKNFCSILTEIDCFTFQYHSWHNTGVMVDIFFFFINTRVAQIKQSTDSDLMEVTKALPYCSHSHLIVCWLNSKVQYTNNSDAADLMSCPHNYVWLVAWTLFLPFCTL